MSRVRGELLLAGVVVVVGIVLAAFTFGSSSSSPSRPSTSARLTALSFARAYLSYLDGRVPAEQLTSATAKVQAAAAAGGVIPASERAGGLRIRGLAFQGVQGALGAKAVLTGADRRRSLRAGLGLAYMGGRWRVSSLVPPDLSTQLAPTRAPASVARSVRRIAAGFALAYADYREHAGPAPSGLPTIREQIRALEDPLAGLSPTGERASLVSLRALAQGSLTSVTAVVRDRQRISFGFVLQRAGGAWRAWQFPVGAQ